MSRTAVITSTWGDSSTHCLYIYRYSPVSGQSFVPYFVKNNIVTVLTWVVDNDWLSQGCGQP